MVDAISRITHNSGLKVAAILAAMPEGEKSVVVKTIIGSATGLAKRKGPDGEKVFYGLLGNFEGTLTGGAIEKSDTIFFAEGLGDKLVALFRVKDPPKAVDIAVDISMERAKNDLGYVWTLTPLLAETNSTDPVEIVRKKLAAVRSAMAKKR